MHHDVEGVVHALRRGEGGSHEQKERVHGQVRVHGDHLHGSHQRNQGQLWLHRMVKTAEVIKNSYSTE